VLEILEGCFVDYIVML